MCIRDRSYISALFGIALEDGHIGSVEDKVETYLPQFVGTGYEGVKIKDVLQMSTGVKFDETYSDPKSDISRYWTGFMTGKSQDKFAETLVREREPGTYNHYVSINTHILGMILAKTTCKNLTDYMQEKIWNPLGAEHDAYWLIDGKGMEMALGGLNASLRDFAKIGRLYLNDGNWNGEQLVNPNWVKESTSASEEHLQAESANSAHPGVGYGYQWWVPGGDEGEFMAIGVFNQHVYVNPSTNTIIARNSANQNFYDQTNPHSDLMTHLALYRKISNTKLKQSSTEYGIDVQSL